MSALSPPGDYDGDGFVGFEDYDLWKSTFGQTGVGLPADGNANGVVDAADYTIWEDHLVRIVHESVGDYNHNNRIDTGDYELWCSTFGQVGANLAADGNGNGIVDAADYTVWRDRFPANVVLLAGSGSSASGDVPQPTTTAGGSEVGASSNLVTVGRANGSLDQGGGSVLAATDSVLNSTTSDAPHDTVVAEASTMPSGESAVVTAFDERIDIQSYSSMVRQSTSRQFTSTFRDMVVTHEPTDFSLPFQTIAFQFSRQFGLQRATVIPAKAWEDYSQSFVPRLDRLESRLKIPVAGDGPNELSDNYLEPELSSWSDLPSVDEAFAVVGDDGSWTGR